MRYIIPSEDRPGRKGTSGKTRSEGRRQVPHGDAGPSGPTWPSPGRPWRTHGQRTTSSAGNGPAYASWSARCHLASSVPVDDRPLDFAAVRARRADSECWLALPIASRSTSPRRRSNLDGTTTQSAAVTWRRRSTSGGCQRRRRRQLAVCSPRTPSPAQPRLSMASSRQLLRTARRAPKSHGPRVPP
ncbi:hypothetical protein EXIGLDRAFT_463288 [Exidia glandulosa HHB12029]|uniref:Uncharacterized protein n=1 Tax=Exidia glandulosa HHB12029 TaxID=1314781 RepID=A0A166AWI7_EXIGL|nr:hypothetical protein EXIGLDRAFT_463288 [Exidia glandulosa HHB12029]